MENKIKQIYLTYPAGDVARGIGGVLRRAVSWRRRLVLVPLAVIVSVPVHCVGFPDLLLALFGTLRLQLLGGARREVVAVLVMFVPWLLVAVDLLRVVLRVGRRLARGRNGVAWVVGIVVEPLVRFALVLLRVVVRVRVGEASRRRWRHLQTASNG